MSGGAVATARSEGGSAIGALRPLCAGTAAAKTAAVSYTGVAGVNATAAVGSKCGFSLSVTADGNGPQTLALFGGASKALSVSVEGGGAQASILASQALNTMKQGDGTLVDTVVHVEFDGAKGDVVTIIWTANTSAAPPARRPTKFNYTELKGAYCGSKGAGGMSCASGQGHAPAISTEKTAAECTAACGKDDTCSCVVYDPKTGGCTKMTRCLPSRATSTNKTAGVDTYIKAYTVLPGLNCYQGHGATDIDAGPAPGLTQAECAERCEAVAGCTGAVHSAGGPRKGDCWMRSNIELSKCGRVGFQTMLMKPTRTEAAVPTPNVALHAARLTRGGAPELPGYEPA